MENTVKRRPVCVILVDNRVRDLPVAALMAHQLERRGIQAELQPLESYRGVLGAFEPDMIVFNHLTASHLVRYSHRLRELGVQVAVLPNEGIAYDPEDLKFLSGKYHNEAHIDHFFAWNEPHKQALIDCEFGERTKIHIVGVPRFDFYFEPWSQLYCPTEQRNSGDKPLILFCTNFVYAKFKDTPKEAEKFFGTWKRMEKYSDPVEFVHIHSRERERAVKFLDALAGSGKYRLLLRPHPLENPEFYRQWFEKLPAASKAAVEFDSASNITTLILKSDVEIACETCTTTLESWIASKPTVELAFERHPSLFHQQLGDLNVLCDDPDKVVAAVDEAVAGKLSPEQEKGRKAHLQKWCDSPSGNSAARIADVISNALKETPRTAPLKLNATDKRRGLKLKTLNALNLAYHFDPLLPIKSAIAPTKYAIKVATYQKSIKPADVRAALERTAKLVD